MLDAVIIILRETLEASLLVGFLFVYSSMINSNKKWMRVAFALGFLSSLLLATFMPEISDSIDGTGQEVVSAFILVSISLLIVLANIALTLRERFSISNKYFEFLYSTIIALAISLEGAEIIIYIQSSFSATDNISSIIVGGILGFGIGVSVGAVSYYFLSFSRLLGVNICLIFLTFVSAGMVSQAISYLMQADIIDSGYAIWNSNEYISEHSVAGQLLYALIGYEASPTISQVVAYGAIIFISAVIILPLKIRKKDSNA